MEAATHLSRATGPGCALRRAGGAAMSSGSRTAGVKSATATISAIFLIPGCAASVPCRRLAVLGPHGDALAVGLHHDHVAVRQAGVRAAGALVVEVIGPGGQVRGQAGQLGTADPHPGPGLDDLLGLPVPAAGQVIRRQGAHPQRVGVIGQRPPGVRRVQVRLAPVAVGQPRRADRPEDAHHAPVMACLHAAVPDPRGAGDLPDPLLARGVDGERGLQQPPLQLPPRLGDHLLPLPVIQAAGLLRRPGEHRGELPGRAGQRRRQLAVHRASLPSSRTCVTVTETETATAGPPLPAGVMRVISAPRSQNRPRNRRTRQPAPPRARPRQPASTTADQHRSPPGDARHVRKAQTLPVRAIQADISASSRPLKRCTPDGELRWVVIDASFSAAPSLPAPGRLASW